MTREGRRPPGKLGRPVDQCINLSRWMHEPGTCKTFNGMTLSTITQLANCEGIQVTQDGNASSVSMKCVSTSDDYSLTHSLADLELAAVASETEEKRFIYYRAAKRSSHLAPKLQSANSRPCHIHVRQVAPEPFMRTGRRPACPRRTRRCSRRARPLARRRQTTRGT